MMSIDELMQRAEYLLHNAKRLGITFNNRERLKWWMELFSGKHTVTLQDRNDFEDEVSGIESVHGVNQ